MSESKHTPGPWTAEQQDRVLSGPMKEEFACWYVSAPRAHTEDSTVVVASCESGETGAETKANARLIAAAPELLAELKALISVVRVDPADFECLGVVSGARAAIAKAEGKS